MRSDSTRQEKSTPHATPHKNDGNTVGVKVKVDLYVILMIVSGSKFEVANSSSNDHPVDTEFNLCDIQFE